MEYIDLYMKLLNEIYINKLAREGDKKAIEVLTNQEKDK